MLRNTYFYSSAQAHYVGSFKLASYLNSTWSAKFKFNGISSKAFTNLLLILWYVFLCFVTMQMQINNTHSHNHTEIMTKISTIVCRVVQLPQKLKQKHTEAQQCIIPPGFSWFWLKPCSCFDTLFQCAHWKYVFDCKCDILHGHITVSEQ